LTGGLCAFFCEIDSWTQSRRTHLHSKMKPQTDGSKTPVLACKTIAKSQQHLVFPGGLPSKYYPGPNLVNFGDLTRTGAFKVVWPLAVEWVHICRVKWNETGCMHQRWPTLGITFSDDALRNSRLLRAQLTMTCHCHIREQLSDLSIVGERLHSERSLVQSLWTRDWLNTPRCWDSTLESGPSKDLLKLIFGYYRLR
jgi:hypothetical protein